MGYRTTVEKKYNIVFKVKNISDKRIKIFNNPIKPGFVRDLLSIANVSEDTIRHSLLKGELYLKIKSNEICVEESNIELLQFDEEYKDFLIEAGISTGIEISSKLEEEKHASFRQLIHLADEGPFEGFSSGSCMEKIGGIFPTSITWYENVTKTKKIVEKLIIRNSNKIPLSIIWRSYNTDGTTILATVIDTITYDGINEVSRVRVFI